MVKISDKSNCCGCTACYSICPRNCIRMIPDEEGFLYPQVIDLNKCENCGLCETVCPILRKKTYEEYTRKAYIVRIRDSTILDSSSSGGFFTPLAEWVFQNSGVVCTATFDKKFNVVHQLFRSNGQEGYQQCRGSKYVQSNLNDCFKEIQSVLNENTLVLFVGTPCQVGGLKSFLRKDYSNLITVDLVCLGTPSPKLWRKYLDYQIQKHKSEIKSINFKNKTYGYHSGTNKIGFQDGTVYYGSARIDYMLKSFYQAISSRPSCYRCNFKGIERSSDFTIFDCWHATDLVPGLKDDDKGFTNVIVQSETGEKILDKIRNQYVLYPIDLKKAVDLDGVMVCNSAKPHLYREKFYKNIDIETLPDHIGQYLRVTKKDYLIERSKIFFYKMGLMKPIRNLIENIWRKE